MEIPAPYLARIQATLPGVDTTAIRANFDGLANDVFVVNDEWVFRFPKNEGSKQALVQESQILDLVRRFVTMPVPVFTWYDDVCVLYRFIPGRPLDRNTFLRLDERAQTRLAEELALFLRQLHTIPPAELSLLSLAADPTPTPQAWRTQLDEIERELFPLLWADQKQWVAELFAPVLDGSLSMNYEPTLIHNDLATYHILYDPADQRINGVIDFGVAKLGDPADDFGILINMLGESILRRMRHAYPEIDTTLDRARFKASVIELWWLLQGLQRNDPSWFLAHIGRARDMMPIGWRWQV